MADYPETPVALSTIDETTPTQAEDAAKIGDALRQTRAIFKNLLTLIMNDDGTLKSTAVTAVADNSVSTAKIQDDAVTVDKIADNAITALQIAANAVTTAKILDDAVTGDKIADNSIIAALIAANAITTIKIIDDAVTADKLAASATLDADRAVSADHIKSSAVTTAKVADLAITPAKLSNIGANVILVGDGTIVKAATIGGDVGAAYDSGTNTLVFTIGGSGAGLSLSTAVIAERAAASAAGGSSVGGAFTVRPAADSGGILTEESDPLNVVSIVSGRIVFAKAGTYMITMSATAYSVGTHVARLVEHTTNTTLFETGSAAAPAGVMNDAAGEGVITIAADATHVRVEHWTEFTKATNGFGLPAGIVGVNNRYLFIRITKVETETA